MSEDRLDIAIDILGTEQKKIKDKLSELEEHKTEWVILFKEMYNYEVKKRSKLKKRIESLEGYTGKANLYDEEGRDYISFLIERIMNLESVLKEERIKSLAFFNSIYPKGKPDYEKYVELCIEYFKRDDLFTKKGAGGNLDVKPDEDKVRIEFIKPTTDKSILPTLQGLEVIDETRNSMKRKLRIQTTDTPAEESSIFREFNLLQKAYDDGKKEKEKELIAEFNQKLRNLPEGMSDEYYYMIEKETLTKLIEEYEKRLEEQEK